MCGAPRRPPVQWAPPPVFITLILSRLLTRLLCRLATNAPRRRPITPRCTAIGLLPSLREEVRLLKLILHSELRRRAASRRALPCPSSSFLFSSVFYLCSVFLSFYHCINFYGVSLEVFKHHIFNFSVTRSSIYCTEPYSGEIEAPYC